MAVKGFQHKEGINSAEIFSHVIKLTTFRAILRLVVNEYLYLELLDVKTIFLHGDLDKDIYMIQPQGFEVQGKEKIVCRLQENLYDFKKVLRQWYKKFDRFMVVMIL